MCWASAVSVILEHAEQSLDLERNWSDERLVSSYSPILAYHYIPKGIEFRVTHDRKQASMKEYFILQVRSL